MSELQADLQKINQQLETLIKLTKEHNQLLQQLIGMRLTSQQISCPNHDWDNPPPNYVGDWVYGRK